MKTIGQQTREGRGNGYVENLLYDKMEAVILSGISECEIAVLFAFRIMLRYVSFRSVPLHGPTGSTGIQNLYAHPCIRFIELHVQYR